MEETRTWSVKVTIKTSEENDEAAFEDMEGQIEDFLSDGFSDNQIDESDAEVMSWEVKAER